MQVKINIVNNHNINIKIIKRCGDVFSITEDDLENNFDIINCGGCSLAIKVIYQLNDNEDED